MPFCGPLGSLNTCAAVLSVCILGPMGCADDGGTPKYTGVRIMTADGWSIDIMGDGSGTVGFGAALGSPFPAKTFVFHDVLRTLQGSATSQRSVPGAAAFLLHDGSGETRYAMYTTDSAGIRKILERAQTAARNPSTTAEVINLRDIVAPSSSPTMR